MTPIVYIFRGCIGGREGCRWKVGSFKSFGSYRLKSDESARHVESGSDGSAEISAKCCSSFSSLFTQDSTYCFYF